MVLKDADSRLNLSLTLFLNLRGVSSQVLGLLRAQRRNLVPQVSTTIARWQQTETSMKELKVEVVV